MKVDNFRGVKVSFTEPVKFSDNAIKGIKDRVNEARRQLKQGNSPTSTPVQIFAIGDQDAELDEDEKNLATIMDDFDLVSLDGDGLDIKLSFPEPLAVSSGNKPDLILLQLELSEFESEAGVKMPESIVKYIEIPSQISSESEAEKIDSASATT